jgi:hypothetical protein
MSVRAFLSYLYLLRVPLLVWLVFIALPFLALPPHAKMGSLARGLFDLASDEPSQAGFSFFFATVAAVMLGASVAITCRLILLYSAERSGAPPIPCNKKTTRVVWVISMLMPLSLVMGLFIQTREASAIKPLAWGFGLAMVAVWVLFAGYHPKVWQIAVEGMDINDVGLVGKGKGVIMILAMLTFPVLWLGRQLVRLSPYGFIDRVPGEPREGPRSGDLRDPLKYALIQLAFSLMLYLVLFLFGPITATIIQVLVLGMLLCWGLTAATFFLDRYRVPLLSAAGVYVFLLSFVPMSDSFYPSIEKRNSIRHAPGPSQILEQHAGKPVVIVASAGGGIQSAAWTARVLSGLHQDLEHLNFDRSVAMLSGVSGGSVGIMYFADAYRKDGHLPGILNSGLGVDELDKYGPVAAAEASSLESVTFGMVYPDLVWGIAPFFRGISWRDRTLTNGHNLTNNRGTWLDEAFKRTNGLKTSTMANWRDDTLAGTRPAVVFNSTIVETGERMLMGTTTLENPGDPQLIQDTYGRKYFTALYPHADLAVVTAARLSATFPYVTPAARIWRGGVNTNEYHIVDGGYYDNYGVATLIDWLDHGLMSPGDKPSKILILAIHSFPEAPPDPPDGQRGLLFQLRHPVTTLDSVRHTGQLSRAETELRFVLRKNAYSVPVTEVVFEYPYTGEEPLSWHLTAFDKKMLHEQWNSGEIQKKRDEVREFFSR